MSATSSSPPSSPSPSPSPRSSRPSSSTPKKFSVKGVRGKLPLKRPVRRSKGRRDSPGGHKPRSRRRKRETPKRKPKESNNACSRWIKKRWDAWDEIHVDAEALKKDTWSTWRAYFCNRAQNILKKFNGSYFCLSLTFCIGQNSIPHFINSAATQGGLAFIMMCLFLYLGVGYPLFIMETSVGQYSAKKPIEIFRFLCPALAGVGPILYLRTVFQYMLYLAIFYYGIYMFYDLFFCQTNRAGVLVSLYKLETDYTNRTIPLFDLGNSRSYSIYLSQYHFLLFAFFIILVLVLRLSLTSVGYAISVVLKTIYFLSICNTVFGFMRISGIKTRTLAYYPLRRVFIDFDASKFISGTAWVEALIFVLSSLGLGTLVHPFLASRSFFHYRSPKDCAYIIFFTIAWIILGSLGLLVWMGYSIANKQEMESTIQLLNTPYGYFYTVPFKFAEACLTDKLEIDVLFFVGMHYALTAILGFLTLDITLLSLICSSYPENTNILLKLCIFCVYVFLITPIFIFLLLTPKGMIVLSFLDYFVNRTAGYLFTIAIFFIAVGTGHEYPKFQYDLRNMLHLKIFLPHRLSAREPKIAFIAAIIFIIFVLIIASFKQSYPRIGALQFSKLNQIFGMILMILPVLIVIFMGLVMCCVHSRKKKRNIFRPHKDWFKNFYHEFKCFD